MFSEVTSFFCFHTLQGGNGLEPVLLAYQMMCFSFLIWFSFFQPFSSLSCHPLFHLCLDPVLKTLILIFKNIHFYYEIDKYQLFVPLQGTEENPEVTPQIFTRCYCFLKNKFPSYRVSSQTAQLVSVSFWISSCTLLFIFKSDSLMLVCFLFFFKGSLSLFSSHTSIPPNKNPPLEQINVIIQNKSTHLPCLKI